MQLMQQKPKHFIPELRQPRKIIVSKYAALLQLNQKKFYGNI